MKTNQLSEEFDSISDEDLQTVCAGLTSALTLATDETPVCFSRL
jgi:hypothetical protein